STMRPRFSLATVVGLAMLTLVIPRVAAAQIYTITALGGGRFATAINASGQVIVYSGYLWSPTSPNGTTGSLTPLSTLPIGSAATVYSIAEGINALGQLAGETTWATPHNGGKYYNNESVFRAA